MPEYLSPGVYVEEVPSSVRPIAGVSTSTAAFIGVIADTIKLVAPKERNADRDPTSQEVAFTVPAKSGEPVLVTNWTQFTDNFGDFVGVAPPPQAPNEQKPKPGDAPADQPKAEDKTKADDKTKTSDSAKADDNAKADGGKKPDGKAADTPQSPSILSPGQKALAHAVYGFFNNGGSRCYVVRIAATTELMTALDALSRKEDIALVAAPGMNDDVTRGELVAHCTNNPGRFAILDGVAKVNRLGRLTEIAAGKPPTDPDKGLMPARSDLAAWYFPWITVFDPATKLADQKGSGLIDVAPSGHIAGIYARVDTQRGVHKAPANEPILGALGVTQTISKAEQATLNPKGVNCIRVLNDNVLVWGARTVGGDLNSDLKYINVRRTLLFLRKSIEAGTQWVVFEPNEPGLWQSITRNVDAFLTNVWRSGALFGTTPQEAFFVKCDASNNPPSTRDLGQVVIDVGVAIVRPAEFVIFRISQYTAPAS